MRHCRKAHLESGIAVIASGMAAAPFTGGLSAIIASLLAAGAVSVGPIMNAYNEAQAANDNFLNFKDLI